MVNRDDLSVEIAESLNKSLETTKIIENCASCRDKKICGSSLELHKSIIKIENCLIELEKVEQGKDKYGIIDELNNELFKTDDKLNKEMLCEGCKRGIEEIKKLTDKCGNEKIAKFLYQCKPNVEYYYGYYILWIPFNEFKDIEYLAKGGFGEVHKAIWINHYNKEREVVLKRIYNSSDKIIDILKEVKVCY